MTIRSLGYLCIGAVLLIAAPAISSAAGTYEIFKAMPASHFSKQDLSMLEGAVVGVLEDESAEAKRSWNNSKNGHSGTVTSLSAFRTADGRPCKKVQIDNSAAGYRSSMKYDICLFEDGHWREADSGAPFGKASASKDAP
jgi:surface antigen